MMDSIVLSASLADAARPDLLPPERPVAEAPFGPFPIHFLDHSQADADAKASRGRHTRLSWRLCDMIDRLLPQAGLSCEDIAGPRTGLVSGSCYGCAQVFEMHLRLRQKGPRGVDPVSFAQATHNYPVSAAAIEFGLEGPCLAAVSVGTAGLEALQIGMDWLQAGRCDRVLVAAYEDLASPTADHLAAKARSEPGKAYGEAMVLLLLERESVSRVQDAPVLEGVAPVSLPCGSGLRVFAEQAARAERFEPAPVDYLGAGGLLALHDLLSGPERGLRGSEAWQVAARAATGGGLAARVRVRAPEMSA